MQLRARCHPTAPLRISLPEPGLLICYCYLPECGREVARLSLAAETREPGDTTEPHCADCGRPWTWAVSHWSDAIVCRVCAVKRRAALTIAPAPPHDPELREWIGNEWDRLVSDAGLEDTKREQAIEQLAQIFEAHSAAISRATPAPPLEAEYRCDEAGCEWRGSWAHTDRRADGLLACPVCGSLAVVEPPTEPREAILARDWDVALAQVEAARLLVHNGDSKDGLAGGLTTGRQVNSLEYRPGGYFMSVDDQDAAIGRLVSDCSAAKKRRSALMSEAHKIGEMLDDAGRKMKGTYHVSAFSDGQSSGYTITSPDVSLRPYPDLATANALLQELREVSAEVRRLRALIKEAGLSVE